MQTEQPRFRKREIAFALAMGVVGAGGAALIIDASNDDRDRPEPREERMAGQDQAARASDGSYEIGEFTKVVSLGPQDVVITQGDSFSVRAEGPDEALDRFRVGIEDGALVIQPRDGNMFDDDEDMAGVTFHVTLPRMESLVVTGSGEVTVDGITGDEFDGVVGGAGHITIANLAVDRVEFSIGGSGEISAAGVARHTTVNIGGSGDVLGAGLRSESADVNVAGSGGVELLVDREAQVSILGSGDVDITGSAICRVSKVGSGDVNCAGDDNSEGDVSEDARDEEG